MSKKTAIIGDISNNDGFLQSRYFVFVHAPEPFK